MAIEVKGEDKAGRITGDLGKLLSWGSANRELVDQALQRADLKKRLGVNVGEIPMGSNIRVNNGLGVVGGTLLSLAFAGLIGGLAYYMGQQQPAPTTQEWEIGIEYLGAETGGHGSSVTEVHRRENQ